jgi:hypothetical protein
MLIFCCKAGDKYLNTFYLVLFIFFFQYGIFMFVVDGSYWSVMSKYIKEIVSLIRGAFLEGGLLGSDSKED